VERGSIRSRRVEFSVRILLQSNLSENFADEYSPSHQGEGGGG
jgi:hypothetical protein